MKEIVNDAVSGNVLIVSGNESKNGSTPDFGFGLATERMFIATQSLGLGARIYGSPPGNIQRKVCFRFQQVTRLLLS